jgi:hypothetical protein
MICFAELVLTEDLCVVQKQEFSVICYMGRTIAQAVSRWLPTAAAAVPSGPSWTPPPIKRIKKKIKN